MLPDLETDFETPNMVSFLPIYFTIVQLLQFYFPKTEYSQLQIRYHHSPRFQSLIDKITSINVSNFPSRCTVKIENVYMFSSKFYGRESDLVILIFPG